MGSALRLYRQMQQSPGVIFEPDAYALLIGALVENGYFRCATTWRWVALEYSAEEVCCAKANLAVNSSITDKGSEIEVHNMRAVPTPEEARFDQCDLSFDGW